MEIGVFRSLVKPSDQWVVSHLHQLTISVLTQQTNSGDIFSILYDVFIQA